MTCQLCRNTTETIAIVRRWSQTGVRLCLPCRNELYRNYQRPYSKIMDALAIAETGYHVNRKLARTPKGGRYA